jgi:hypothetical protein
VAAKLRANVAGVRTDAQTDELLTLLSDLARQGDVRCVMQLVGSAPSM